MGYSANFPGVMEMLLTVYLSPKVRVDSRRLIL